MELRNSLVAPTRIRRSRGIDEALVNATTALRVSLDKAWPSCPPLFALLFPGGLGSFRSDLRKHLSRTLC